MSDSEMSPASKASDVHRLVRCKRCGVEGRCVELENPDTKDMEYFIRPAQIGRCEAQRRKNGEMCKTSLHDSMGAAVEAWNYCYADT